MELIIKAKAYQLKFRHPFGVAHGIRDSTDSLFVSATFAGKTGYGEAALPPYLGYDVNEIVLQFPEWFPGPMDGIEAISNALLILKKSSSAMPSPARAATDIALLDLWGKLTAKPVRDLLNIPAGDKTLCTYTLGISPVDEMIAKLKEASDFRFFKIKLGGDNDHERVNTFLENSKHPFCVDANQCWLSAEKAVEEIRWLKEKGCVFVEQPLPVNMKTEMEELFSKTELPLILDESIQNIHDLESLHYLCHGINIKLVKCGGITPAIDLIRRARKLNKYVLIGCMSESSCGAAAASQLSGWADWVDLDGPALISNDPFEGIIYREGVLVTMNSDGIGVDLKKDVLDF